MKEISIEEYRINHNLIHVEFFEGNDEKSLTRPVSVFENYCVKNKLLNWHEHKKKMDGHWEELEGTLTFDQFIEARVTDEILEAFIKSELEK